MSFPHSARTIKDTHLIVLGGDNVSVLRGTPITVFGEDGPFGTVSIMQAGQEKFGSMLRSDYS